MQNRAYVEKTIWRVRSELLYVDCQRLVTSGMLKSGFKILGIQNEQVL